jgi:hypothetical protein
MPYVFVARLAQTESEAGNSSPGTGGVAAALRKKTAKPTFILMLRAAALALRERRRRARSVRALARNIKVVGHPERFRHA